MYEKGIFAVRMLVKIFKWNQKDIWSCNDASSEKKIYIQHDIKQTFFYQLIK